MFFRKGDLCAPHLRATTKRHILNRVKTKANIFNEYFDEQCTLLKNSSALTFNQAFLTQSRLISLDFNKEEILKIIRDLNINKAHGHDDICIRIIKNCDKSL